MRTILFLVAAVLIVGSFLSACRSEESGKIVPLNVYCAAGLRDPLTDLIPIFEKAHAPAKVHIDYGGSGELLGRLKTVGTDHRPDIFIAAEETYAQQARELGLIDSIETMAYFVPVLVVAKGNPKGIGTLADLARPDVKTALGEPRGPAIGLVTDQILQEADLMFIRQKVGGSFPTVQAVATQVALKNADAGIIWDATARQGDWAGKLEVLPIPNAPIVRIVICRVTPCRKPGLTDAFLQLLTATSAARESFRTHGFSVDPPPTTPTP